MISHDGFIKVRLSHFVSLEKTVYLNNWEFRDRLWIGEAHGFTEVLRPVEDAEHTLVVALDLAALPGPCNMILQHLELPLAVGQPLPDLVERLGAVISTSEFVNDRRSYQFQHDSAWPYKIDCTVHSSNGLIYVVVAHPSA